jgi:hypothetical protein
MAGDTLNYQSATKGGSSHLSIMMRDRVVSQATVDTMADIVDAPLTLLRYPDIQSMYERFIEPAAGLGKLFPSLASLREFVKQTNSDPRAASDPLNRHVKEWEDIFRSLASEIFISRTSRIDPLIHQLRENRTWRWLETLALYEKLMTRRGSAPFELFDKVWPGTWVVDVIEWDSLFGKVILLIGPLKRAGSGFPTSGDAFIAELARVIEPGFLVRADAARYDEVLNDRPAISQGDLITLTLVLRHTIEFLDHLWWPEVKQVDRLDAIAAVDLGCFVSQLRTQLSPFAQSSRPPALSIMHHYPVHFLKEGDDSRTLEYRGRLDETMTGDCEILASFARVDMRSIVVSSLTPEAAATVNDKVSAPLTIGFDRLARRRASAQVQRLSETIHLLRHRLMDDFGLMMHQTKGWSGFSIDRQRKVGSRIARAAVELCNASTGVVFCYDYEQSVLVPVGTHSASFYGKRFSIEDYKWMSAVGLDSRRDASVSYAAVDHNRTVIYGEETEFSALKTHHSQVPPPDEMEMQPGKALIAVPIRVFDRIWGVLEVSSDRVNAFLPTDVAALEKISDEIGNYYHEQTMMGKLYDMTNAPQRDLSGSSNLDPLARQVADVFLCGAACIWTQDLLSATTFHCAGITGRPDLEPLRQYDEMPSIDMKDKASVAMRMVAEHKTWISGVFGEPPFDGEWLKKPHTASLVKLGFRFIALAPIYGIEGNVSAVISLYSKSLPFKPAWETWALYVSKYVGSVISRVHNPRDVDRIAHRLTAHEIKNSLIVVEQLVRRISGAVRLGSATEKTSPASVSPNLGRWLQDARTHLTDAMERVDQLAGDGAATETKRKEALDLLRVEERAQSAPAEPTNFRREFNTCIQPLRSKIRDRGLVLVNQGFAETYVAMDAENLRIILTNLTSNAIKYSRSNTRITYSLKGRTFTTQFTITNEGPAIGVEEQGSIFKLYFRGNNARGIQEGSGLGLYLVDWICSLYKLVIKYRALPSRNAGDAMHQFTLDFPNKLIVR